MEILIVVALMSIVVKRGVEDIIHTAKGGTPPRYAAASARRKSGAAGRYWGQLWDDVWEDATAKRAAKRAGRTEPGRPPRPRGAARQFFAGLAQDGRRAAGRRWQDGWVRLDEKRREKATRPRPGQVTVPGTVVPNAQDEDEARPQDGTEDRPVPEPRIVPTVDGRTDLRFGEDDNDPTGVSSCPECHGTVLVDGEICLSCRDRQEQRNQHHEEQDEDGIRRCPSCGNRLATVGPTCPSCIDKQEDETDRLQHPPDSGPDKDIAPPIDPTTEGTPTMTTMPTGEVTSLAQTIRFCEDSAQAYRAQAHAIEQTQATLAAEEVSGPAAAAFADAMEQSQTAALSMERAAGEFKKHLVVTEAYDQVQGAGTKAFVTAGR